MREREKEELRRMLSGRVLVASLAFAPHLGQVEAALAESASWGMGRKGVVALALCLSLVTRSRSGESVGDSRKLGPLITTTA